MATYRPIFVLTASLLIVPLATRPAGANFVTASVSTTPSQGTTDYSQVLTAPAFNTTLGTLNDVVITMADAGFFSGSLTNNSATAQDFTVTEGIHLTLTAGSTLLLSDDLASTQSYTALASGATSPFGSASPVTSAPAAPQTITSGAIFDAFNTSTTGVPLTFSTLTGTTIQGGGGNLHTGIFTTAGSVITIRFDYTPGNGNPGGEGGGGGGTPATPAPEPASLVMTALGGLLVVAARRARRPGPRAG